MISWEEAQRKAHISLASRQPYLQPLWVSITEKVKDSLGPDAMVWDLRTQHVDIGSEWQTRELVRFSGEQHISVQIWHGDLSTVDNLGHRHKVLLGLSQLQTPSTS